MTDSERKLWSQLRGKHILGVQFYRQKPIGNYIVDFFAPTAKLVIEVDGSQHKDRRQMQRDKDREEFLTGAGLRVLRFHSNQVLTKTDEVVEVVYRKIAERLK